jgi:hypothetical protein
MGTIAWAHIVTENPLIFRNALANFLNKLETDHFVSKTAVGKICQEMLALAGKVHTSTLHDLMGRLDVTDHQRQILRDCTVENPFVELQKEFRSYYHLDKYIKGAPVFKFVAPTEIQLGPEKKTTFQYISIVETVTTICQDPDFQREAPSEDGMLRGVKDGYVYAENPYFQEWCAQCPKEVLKLSCT